MAARLLILIGLLWLSGISPSHAQVPDNDIPYGNWWRGCASLDLDFYHDQYYINNNTTCDGTVGTTYSGAAYGTNVTNFITGTGATFTRAGSNVTSAAAPFYLSSIQTFVSRASVTNNVTSTFAPFYTNSSQAWVSRADGGTAKATYFDSTGTLQTAAAGTARNAAYYYNGSAWVAQAANALPPQTISSITDSSGTATVTTGAAHGLVAGNSVTVSGAYPSNYNGTFTIASVPTTTTFTYTMASDPGVSASQVGLYTTTATTPAVLVEPAATNYIRNNTMAGAAAGTPGTSPTDWNFSTTGAGLTRTIVGSGTTNGISYIDVQFSGTPTATGAFGNNFEQYAQIAASVGQTWTASAYFSLQAGSLANTTLKLYIVGYNSSGIQTEAPSTTFNPTSTLSQVITTRTLYNTATAYIVPNFQFTVTSGQPINFTVRIGMPQLEQNPEATSVIATSSAAVTRAADVYSQQPASYVDGTGTLNFTPANTARTNHNTTSPYASLGTLIEPAATNSIRNNMTVGAVAADGVERTNNGTFSTTSPNVCSGSDISSGNSLSCSSGTAVTAQTISSITYSGTTATVTTGAAHNLTIGYIVTIAGVTGTSAASYNGSFMVVSAPSSTTFTYKMITAPTSNATVTGASYTATAGGWAGTVNGGTGTVTGSSGSMTLTGDGTNAASVYEAIPTTSVCSVDVVVTMGSGGPATFLAGTSVGASNLGSTTVASGTTTKFTLTTSGPVGYLQINNTSATAANVISVSVQSAGCPSTDWPQLNIALGLSGSVLDTGTINGVPYIDVKVTGTTTSALLPLNQNFENFSQIAASSGQTWTESCYLALISGTIPNTVNLVMAENNSSGSNIQFDASSNLSLTGTLTRYSVTKTLSNASTAYVQPAVWVYSTGVGQAVNFTLRIGMPQMEKSSYATSVIPTLGSTVTRTADVYNQPVGTYFNSSGVLTTAANNTPRMDHSPTGNYAPQGVLIEEARTNSILYSSQYVVGGGGGWSDNGYGAETINHTTTAPDGSLAYSIAATANFQGWWYNFLPTASTTYTYSVFAKNLSGGSIVQIGPSGNCWGTSDGSAQVSFNTITGAFSGINAGVLSYGAQQLANGWWRAYVTTTANSTACGASALTNYPFSGSVASENAFWGNQMEVGVFPTSYIPTTGSSITRQKDVFAIPTSAGGGWSVAGTGTIGVVGTTNYQRTSQASGLLSFTDGTTNNAINMIFGSTPAYDPNDLDVEIFVGGSGVAGGGNTTNFSLGSPMKEATTYQASNIRSAENGKLSSLGTSTFPTFTTLNLGVDRINNNDQLDGWLRRVWYEPVYQTNNNSLIDYSNGN